jgi:hypothetical protein
MKSITHYKGGWSTAKAKGENEMYVLVASPECKTLLKISKPSFQNEAKFKYLRTLKLKKCLQRNDRSNLRTVCYHYSVQKLKLQSI